MVAMKAAQGSAGWRAEQHSGARRHKRSKGRPSVHFGKAMPRAAVDGAGALRTETQAKQHARTADFMIKIRNDLGINFSREGHVIFNLALKF